MTRSFPNNSLVCYTSKGKNSAFSVGASQQAMVYNARAFNNSGGAINVGICQRYNAAKFSIWSYVAVGPTYANISAAVNAGTASDIFTGTNNDGFLVQARQKFGLVGFTVSTANAGATVTYKYWSGSSFTTLTTLEVPSYASTGDKFIVFQPPDDSAWVKGAPASSGMDTNQFTIQVISTTAPAAHVAINAIWVANFLELYQAVPNNACVQMSYPDSKPYVLDGGEGLMPYFATANNANQFGAYWAFNG